MKRAVIALMLGVSAPALAEPDAGPLLAPPPPTAPSFAESPWLPEYPARARMEGREGITYVRLAAGADGTVTDCVMTRSSGHDDFDAVACRVAIRRARIPAAPEGGKLRYYILPVKWALEKPLGPPPELPRQ